MKKFHLKDFLKICTKPGSPEFESACMCFISQYKAYIYAIVYKRGVLWYQNQQPAEMSETVNDIVHDIYFLLFKNNARALKNFNASHSELAFRGYLATISDRLTRRILRKKVIHSSIEGRVETKEYSIDQDKCWQIFDYVVTTLRQKTGRQGKHVEQNILLFNLYTTGDMTREMIQATPIFKKIGHRVVDNVVLRSRAKIDSADENNLREMIK